MWTPKHGISYPKIYELLLKTDTKLDHAIYLNKFYNRVKMYLNSMKKMREDILYEYHKIKGHSKFHEHFTSYHYHPYYSWNEQTHTYLGH